VRRARIKCVREPFITPIQAMIARKTHDIEADFAKRRSEGGVRFHGEARVGAHGTGSRQRGFKLPEQDIARCKSVTRPREYGGKIVAFGAHVSDSQQFYDHDVLLDALLLTR